jgi:hypothetical protein
MALVLGFKDLGFRVKVKAAGIYRCALSLFFLVRGRPPPPRSVYVFRICPTYKSRFACFVLCINFF